MRLLKSWLTIAFVLGLIFIGIGDTFLPEPLSNVSKNTRTRVNQMLLKLTPNPQIRNPNDSLSEQVEEAEKKATGN